MVLKRINKNKPYQPKLKGLVEVDIEDNQSIKEKLQTIKFKQRLVVNMELRSGRVKTFIVDSSKRSFEFQEGEYIIDSTLMIYNESYRLYSLDYHQDYCLPVKRSIPVNEIKDGIKHTQASQVEYASNPATMLEFLRSNIIQSVIRAGDFLKKLETYKLLWFVTAISSVLHLVVYLQQIGFFASVTASVSGGGG